MNEGICSHFCYAVCCIFVYNSPAPFGPFLSEIRQARALTRRQMPGKVPEHETGFTTKCRRRKATMPHPVLCEEVSILLERSPDPHPRAPTGLALHFQLSTDSMSALAHSGYFHSFLGRVRLEALPVIGHLCPMLVLFGSQCYP